MIRSFSYKIGFIYLTKIISVLTGFLSMVTVLPLLVSNTGIFGVYTVCVSLSLFFSYADLGFVNAGQKYAAEYFAMKDLNKEISVIGFVLFIGAIIILIVSAIVLFAAFNPTVLLKSGDPDNLAVSRMLLLTLSFSGITVLFQRYNHLVYSIRVEDYIYQSIDVLGNMLKIACIQFFITKTSYDIVGYFVTIQAISFLSSVVSLVISIQKYHYNPKQILISVRFSTEMFNLTKGLALSSLLTTISFILWYEVDAVILGAYYGPEVVSVYAIGFTLLSLFRTVYNTIYSPFLTRFNHFVGAKNEFALCQSFRFLTKTTLPLCIIPPAVIIFYMRDIIATWLGCNYSSSVYISQLYVATAALSHGFLVPISFLMISKSQHAVLRVASVTMPIVFYSSLFIFHFYFGNESLAYAKILTAIFNLTLTFYLVSNNLGIKSLNVYASVLKKIIFPIVVMLILFWKLPVTYFEDSSKIVAYFRILAAVSPSLIIPLVLYYYLDVEIRCRFVRFLDSFY